MIRPVSPTEWFYLGGLAVAPPFAVQIVVEGSGTVDPAVLNAAVAAASGPGARLVQRGRRWLDSGLVPPVRVIEPGALPAAMTKVLDPVAGPTCEVLLTDGTLVFRAYHGVMDGRGALTWIADVFRALRGEEVLGADATVTDEQLVRRLGATGHRPMLRPQWPSPLEDPAASVRPGDHLIQRRSLDGNHPGLVAKIAAVLSADVPRRLMIPVDLRRHDPKLASTGNLSLPVFLDTTAGETWPQLHSRLLTSLREDREVTLGSAEKAAYRLPARALGPLVRAGSTRVGKSGKFLCSAIISHLGRLDVADYSAPGFTALTVRPLPTHAPVSIVAAEVAGRTEIAISGQAGGAMADRASALLDAITEELDPASARAWGTGPASSFSPRTVVELFEEQVRRTPSAVALTGPEGDVSYAELERRSAVIAQELRARGIGPGAVVGLLAGRTVTGLSGLWGILRAGAAWLPLEPKNPDDRLTYIVTDARAALCLTEARYAHRLTAESLILDDLLAAPADSLPVLFPAGPAELAWVIYTLGSTGDRKASRSGIRASARSCTGRTANTPSPKPHATSCSPRSASTCPAKSSSRR